MGNSPEQLTDATVQLILSHISDVKDFVRVRFDAQDVVLEFQNARLAKLEEKADKTNGRVTKLEQARLRAQGIVAAFHWVPALFAACCTAGITSLVFVLVGGTFH